jgi:hypothetical protein
MPPNGSVSLGQATSSSSAVTPSRVSASPAVSALVALVAVFAETAVVAVSALYAETAVRAWGTIPSEDSSMTLPPRPFAFTWLLVSVPFFNLPAPIERLIILLPLIEVAA